MGKWGVGSEVYKFANLSREEVEAMLGLRLEDSRILREAKEQGHAEGKRENALAIVLRQLPHCVGMLDESLQQRVQQLSNSQLEDLSEALLDFATLADLVAWLEVYPVQEFENPE